MKNGFRIEIMQGDGVWYNPSYGYTKWIDRFVPNVKEAVKIYNAVDWAHGIEIAYVNFGYGRIEIPYSENVEPVIQALADKWGNGGLPPKPRRGINL